MGVYPISSLKKGGLSYISRTEKSGSIELSLPVHLLYGSNPPPGIDQWKTNSKNKSEENVQIDPSNFGMYQMP